MKLYNAPKAVLFLVIIPGSFFAMKPHEEKLVESIFKNFNFEKSNYSFEATGQVRTARANLAYNSIMVNNAQLFGPDKQAALKTYYKLHHSVAKLKVHQENSPSPQKLYAYLAAAMGIGVALHTGVNYLLSTYLPEVPFLPASLAAGTSIIYGCMDAMRQKFASYTWSHIHERRATKLVTEVLLDKEELRPIVNRLAYLATKKNNPKKAQRYADLETCCNTLKYHITLENDKLILNRDV